MNGVFRRIARLSCLLVLVGVLPAVAQVSTGQIMGKVTDTTGAVLPGVVVTITSSALIQPQTVITSESGGFQFPKIPIGIYTVTFDLTGFKKLVRQDIEVTAGFNAQIDAKLELSTVQETITVTGESPVVDTKSTTLSAHFSKEALDKIPSARDPWVVIQMVPGMVMSGMNVGGNLSGQQTSFTAFGSGSNQQWNIDGAVISDVASGNSSPNYWDFDSFDEIQVTTGGSDSSQQAAGVQINLVTKSGGNTIRGSGRFYDTNHKFEAQNITTALRDQGNSGGNPIQDIKDYGIEIGGPIVKNKLWYWGAASDNTIHVGVVNFYDKSLGTTCQTLYGNASLANSKDAAGNYVYALDQIRTCLQTDETVLLNQNGKLQFQENPSNKSTFVITDGIKTRNSRDADAFHPIETTRRQDGPTIIYRSEHQWIASHRMTLTAQYTHMYEDWGLFRQSDDLADIQTINYVDTNFWARSTANSHNHNIRPQDDIRADGNYYLSNVLGGDHSMKFGFSYRRSPVEALNEINGGARVRIRQTSSQNTCTVGGVTGLCNEADIIRDGDSSYILYGRSAYINDSYKTGRVTVNMGVRFDRQFDIAETAKIPANRILPDLLPAISFAGADSGVRFNNLSPRVGVTLDLRGNGKTVMKANTGRYYGVDNRTAGTLQPTGTTSLRYAWRDLNGDTSVQRNELDFVKGFLQTPTSNYDQNNPNAVTTPARVDSSLRNDITDELIVGLDHELMNNFGVGVSYIYRKYHDFSGTYRTDPADVSGAYAPVTFTASCGNVLTCGNQAFSVVYYQQPAALHAQTTLRNDGNYNTYSGVQLTARRRLANRWMMTGSLVHNHQLSFSPQADRDYLDPTNHDFTNGYESGSRNGKWVGKLSGLYQFPWDVTASANFAGGTGGPFNPNILSPNRTGSGGSISVLLQPNNTIRLPNVYQLDFHADKSFRVGGQRRLVFNFDLFNVGNNNVVLAKVERQNSSTANNVTTIMAPRVARFGLKFNF